MEAQHGVRIYLQLISGMLQLRSPLITQSVTLHVHNRSYVHADLLHHLWPHDSRTKLALPHGRHFCVHADLFHHLSSTVLPYDLTH